MSFNSYVESILESRYYRKTRSGEVVENWESLCDRVAKVISGVEHSPEKIAEYYPKFFDMLHSTKFLPNSPTLAGAGDPRLTLSACFVLGIKDTTHSIFNAISESGIVTKWGGGFGIDFSKLRPKGFPVGHRGGIASGAVSFLRMFDVTIDVMKQGGTRKGAMMASLRDGHPDIFEFIRCKNDGGLCNMNLSVTTTDAFMQRVKDDRDWELRFDSYTWGVKARDVFNAICQNAWETGDPGVIFIDRMNKDNTILGEKIKTTNVCGEIPAINNGACNLGSIDIAKFILSNKETDWDELGEIVKDAVRFLDNVIDANNYPTEAISDTVKKYRIIGLGIMGFADYLIKKGVRYGSDESIEEARKVLAFIREKAEKATFNLGQEKGNFPALRKTTFKDNTKYRRNAALMAIAPTGTISMIAGCSSGIEPYYSYESYSRKTNEGKTLVMHNPWVQTGFYDPAKPEFVSSMQIPYQEHLKIQAVAQELVDGGISKTINMANSATVENVKDAFMTAWETGCKGVTVFRDGCKKEGLFKELCPECGAEIIKVESCKKCLKCGWSACSVA